MTDDSTFADYLGSLATLGELPEAREAALTEAETRGREQVDRALAAEASFKAQRRDLEGRVQRLQEPVNRLRRATGGEAVGSAAFAGRTPETWDDLLRAVQNLGQDVERAQRDREWLERRGQQSQPEARRSGPPAPPPPPPAPAPAPRIPEPAVVAAPEKGRLALTPLGWAAIVAVLLVLVVVLALVTGGH